MKITPSGFALGIGFTVLAGVMTLGSGCSSSSAVDNSSGTDAGNTQSGKDGSSTSTSASAACASLATAICERTSTCTSFALNAIFGSSAACVTSETASCMATLSAPKTSATAANTLACATAFPQISCSDFVAGNFGTACALLAGGVANGGACGDNSQCASTFCAVSATANCGTCAAPPAAGAACVDSDCPRGLTCTTAASPTCAAPGTGQAGATCTTNEDCDLAHGVGCNTNAGQCIALTIATTSCGANSPTPTSFAICPGSGTCSALISGTCSAAAAVGDSCDATNGPNCAPPAKCISGKCATPDPSSCN